MMKLKKICDLIKNNPRKEKAILKITTPGGSPDCAYKIAREFQNHYKEFILYNSAYCMSAGTLIAIGADKIVMELDAQFGPLDIQMKKEDELLGHRSGFDVLNTLEYIENRTSKFFASNTVELSKHVSFKVAADICCNLAKNLHEAKYKREGNSLIIEI